MTPKSCDALCLALSSASGQGTKISVGIGCQKSGARTPITVYGSLFRVKLLPKTRGSDPKRRFQNPFVRTATGYRAFPASLSGRKAAAEDGPSTEHRQEIRRHTEPNYLLRFPSPGQSACADFQ
jgi:hypothetical protein